MLPSRSVAKWGRTGGRDGRAGFYGEHAMVLWSTSQESVFRAVSWEDEPYAYQTTQVLASHWFGICWYIVQVWYWHRVERKGLVIWTKVWWLHSIRNLGGLSISSKGSQGRSLVGVFLCIVTVLRTQSPTPIWRNSNCKSTKYRTWENIVVIERNRSSLCTWEKIVVNEPNRSSLLYRS